VVLRADPRIQTRQGGAKLVRLARIGWVPIGGCLDEDEARLIALAVTSAMWPASCHAPNDALGFASCLVKL
jgi:hypothetical protein